MKHTRHAATTVALRAVLAGLVAVVGLACLFAHATQQSQVASDEVSVSRAVAQPSTDDSSGAKPCAKKLMTAEAGVPQGDGTYQAGGAPALLPSVEPAGASQHFDSAPLAPGPAPPPPLPPFSVMRV